MLDPDSIIITNTNNSNIINMQNVPVYDYESYPDLDEDKKMYKKYITDIEREVRSMIEYSRYTQYLRDYMGMNRCSYLANVVSGYGKKTKVEIHHYPFTLFDIVEIVYKKRFFYNESLYVPMVAKEVMILHYNLMVGLISLSETVHKLVHANTTSSGKIFIPIDKVLGRYNLFIDYYDRFITDEQKDIIERIEKYSKEETSELLNTMILDTNNVSINIVNEEYRLPDTEVMNTNLINRIQTIKSNDYILPTVNDGKKMIEDKRERKPIRKLLYNIEGR